MSVDRNTRFSLERENTQAYRKVSISSNRPISRELAKEFAEYYYNVNVITVSYEEDEVYIDWSSSKETRILKFEYCPCCLTPIPYNKHFDCEIDNVLRS